MKKTQLLLALSTLFLASGCVVVTHDGGDTTGDLTVTWPNFDGLSCSQAGVDTVEVQLLDATASTVLDDATFDCGAGGATWNALDPGDYVVYVDAYDSYGNDIWQATVDASVFVGSNDYTADFYQVDGSLTVSYTFGGSGICGAVYDVHIHVEDDYGNVYDDSTDACSDGGYFYYDSIPAGDYYVTLDGLDSTGRNIYESNVKTVTVVAGSSNPYTVNLYGI